MIKLLTQDLYYMGNFKEHLRSKTMTLYRKMYIPCWVDHILTKLKTVNQTQTNTTAI